MERGLAKITKSSAQPVRKTAVILFAEIYNSVFAARVLSLQEYYNLITDFQQRMQDIAISNLPDGWEVSAELCFRGNEMCVKMYSGDWDDEACITEDVHRALEMAMEMKIGWLRSRFNEPKIRKGFIPFGLGIGVNLGQVMVGTRTIGREEIHAAEGYAVNLAKRIEAAAQGGDYSQIMISESVRVYIDSTILPLDYVEIPWEDSEQTTIYEIKDFALSEKGRERQRVDKRTLGIWRDALKADPRTWLAFVLGYYAFAEELYDLSVESYERAVAIDPDVTYIRFNLGQAHYRMGKYSEAREQFQAAARLKPQLADIWYSLGLAHAKLGETDRELDCYREGANAGTATNPRIWINISQNCLVSRDYESSLQAAQRGLEACSEEEELLFPRIICEYLVLCSLCLLHQVDKDELISRSDKLSCYLNEYIVHAPEDFDHEGIRMLLGDFLEGEIRNRMLRIAHRLARRITPNPG